MTNEDLFFFVCECRGLTGEEDDCPRCKNTLPRWKISGMKAPPKAQLIGIFFKALLALSAGRA